MFIINGRYNTKYIISFIIVFTFYILTFIPLITVSDQIGNNKILRSNIYPPEGWSEDIRLSRESSDYSCQFQNIAVNGFTVHILWDENLNSLGVPGKGLCYRRSLDGGNNWDNIFYLTEPYDSVSNDIAVSDSNVHVIFTSHIPNTTGLKYRRSMDNGLTWGSIKTNITNYSGTDLNIEIFNNTVHVVYCYRNETKKEWGIIYLRGFNNGNNWERPKFLINGSGITNNLFPKLSIYKNNLYVVYWGVNNTIELITSRDNGDTWEFETLYNGPDVSYPQIATYKNHVGVVWVNTSIPLEELEFMALLPNWD